VEADTTFLCDLEPMEVELEKCMWKNHMCLKFESHASARRGVEEMLSVLFIV
jgi:hypothetical protein